MEKNEPTQSKYDAALAKYNTQLDDAEIAAQAARIYCREGTGKQYTGGKEIPVQLHRPYHPEE